jgi:hypothetical protein
MDLYNITKFLHILTLLAAAGATVAVEIGLSRRARARTVKEALEWHNVVMSASKVFPIVLLAFVVTGSYMLSINRLAWSTGFIVSGLTGVAILLTGGVFLGVKGKALKQMLEGMAKNGGDQPAPKLVPPLLVAAIPKVNPAIAVAVAFNMVTKPTSVPVALSVLAIGIAIGLVMAMRDQSVVAEEASAA